MAGEANGKMMNAKGMNGHTNGYANGHVTTKRKVPARRPQRSYGVFGLIAR
jgi:hypothetical protein